MTASESTPSPRPRGKRDRVANAPAPVRPIAERGVTPPVLRRVVGLVLRSVRGQSRRIDRLERELAELRARIEEER